MATKEAGRKPLTQDKQVRALGAEATVYEHSIAGTPGLRIRISPTGRKVWFYRYRNREDGKLEKLKLGEYREGGMSLADARQEAERQRAIANEHGSARKYRDAERAENRQALVAKLAETERDAYTVAKMVEAYLDEASRKLKSYREVARCFDKYVLPYLGTKPASEVTRSDVIEVLDRLNKAGKAVQANRVQAYVRRAFNWALRKGKVAANPCALIERNTEKAKERAMGDAEIKRFLTNLPDTEIEEAIADAYRLILLTGMRPGEAAGLAFGNVDEDENTIRLEDTKNGRTHTIPTCPQVMAIIKRRRAATKSAYVFPAPRDHRQPIRPDAFPKPLRDAIPTLKVLPITPHDLRRSFATGLARIGTPRLLISLALNHAISGVTGIYDRHSYQSELRDWLTRWANHVDMLVRRDGATKELAA